MVLSGHPYFWLAMKLEPVSEKRAEAVLVNNPCLNELCVCLSDWFYGQFNLRQFRPH